MSVCSRVSATQAYLNIEENAWKDSLGASECSLMPTIEECPLRGASFEATTMHGVHILPFLGSLRPFFYLQSTLSIPEPLNSDVVDHAGQTPAGGTSKLENTKNNETFKQPQDERDTLQPTTPQQLASNIDGHKPPLDTADGHKPPVDSADGHKPPVDTADGHKPPVDTADEHKPPVDTADEHKPPVDTADEHKPPLDTATTTNTQPYSDAKKNGAASSPVPSEQVLCVLQSE